MTATAFRLWADDDHAPAELARSIEEIHVTQSTDAGWEAELVIVSCLDSRGHWSREAEDHLATHRRLRVDVRSNGEWIPLIDGPTIGVDVSASGEPNQSRVTLRVRDDSATLDGHAIAHVFPPDTELRQVISDTIAMARGTSLSPEIELGDAAEPDDEVPRSYTIRGTPWAFLTRLAEERGMFVRVLPGPTAGRSRAVFGPRPDPGEQRAPALVLSGHQRNLESFDATVASDQPGRALASTISIGDRTVTSHTASLRDTDLLGDSPVVADEDVAVLVEPGAAERIGPSDAAEAVLRRRGFIIDARGAVEGRCYGGVLRPYDYVDVRGVQPRLAGTYLVQAVTHSITRGSYRQEFTLWRNAATDDNVTDPTGSIF